MIVAVIAKAPRGGKTSRIMTILSKALLVIKAKTNVMKKIIIEKLKNNLNEKITVFLLDK